MSNLQKKSPIFDKIGLKIAYDNLNRWVIGKFVVGE